MPTDKRVDVAEWGCGEVVIREEVREHGDAAPV
jgi:hypothetical protein